MESCKVVTLVVNSDNGLAGEVELVKVSVSVTVGAMDDRVREVNVVGCLLLVRVPVVTVRSLAWQMYPLSVFTQSLSTLQL